MFVETRTFPTSRAAVFFLAVVSLLLFFLAGLSFMTLPEEDRTLFSSILTFLGIVSALSAYCLFKLSVSVGPEGVETRSAFGEKMIPWRDFREFYYREKRVRIETFITIGTNYYFRLATGDGRRIRIGGFGKKYKRLGLRLIAEINELMEEGMWRDYENGLELRFGKQLRLNRYAGLSVKGLLGWRSARVEDLRGYAVKRGSVFFPLLDGGKLGQVAIGRTPNVFVLMTLLNRIMGRPAALNDPMQSAAPLF